MKIKSDTTQKIRVVEVLGNKPIDYSKKNQFARIRFVNDEFDECTFQTVCDKYNRDDWQFLHDVAEFILEESK